jgi:polyphosphate glucokinase
MQSSGAEERILSVDIGGSRIKATILDISGNMIVDYQRISTPRYSGPKGVIQAIVDLTKNFESYTKVSVGFPGYVRGGKVFTAPNLGTEQWAGFNLSKQLCEVLEKPVRVVNDADMQGLGVASGEGLEMVITLGTGFGTALLMNGILLPHLEIAHHPLTRKKDYDQYIGNKALEDIGVDKWNQRMKKVIEILKTVFNYDKLYISGGNAKRLAFKLDKNITLVSNIEGIRGGARLWVNDGHYGV